LFGPTKVGRKGYTVGLGRSQTLIFDEPQRLELDIDASVSGNLDQLPDFQNIPVNVDRLTELEARLEYSNVRRSLGAVDDETGTTWSAVSETSNVDSSLFTRVRGTYDRGFALPAGHSSLWFRQAAGVSPHAPDEPFSNFFFGGFGNNYVDHLTEKRYRTTYSLPGLELNELGGRNFVKSTVDLNLPPLRFQNLGSPGFYVPWMRSALFVSGLATNLDQRSVRRGVLSAGAQVDLNVNVLSVLEMMVSAGTAVAVEEGHRPRYELMLSLKVLR
jgi:hypothetical protein